MSLSLDRGTVPAGTIVKTFGHGVDQNVVHLGTYEISLIDFLTAAMYVLTNSDLVASDERYDFVRAVNGLREVQGFDIARTRYAGP